MEIIGRNPNPDEYSIKEMRVDYRNRGRVRLKDGTEKPIIDVSLLIDLEPEFYSRQRFADGSSYEKKKNPCTLRINLGEFREMQQLVSRRLEESYQFLFERRLLGELPNPNEKEKASNEASHPS
jgi:hypothetical protein